MSDFWKVVALGATAAAAFVVAREFVERHENGEDCSPVAVLKGIGRKIGKLCEDKCGGCDDDYDDYFSFEDFETDDSDDDVDGFDADDVDGDELTDEGYILEFSAEEESKADEAAAEDAEPAADSEKSDDAE